MEWGAVFERGLEYEPFLERFGTEDQRARWRAVFERTQLSEGQRRLLRSFVREMKVIVVAGAWCGDCVNQCPIFARFAEEAPVIRLRFFDRDAFPELADELSICGGRRVPSVLFLSEDDYPCGRYGDRTLSKYRQMVASLSGAACPTGVAEPDDLHAAVVQEWLNEFERIQWMLRTSARLRQIHGD